MAVRRLLVAKVIAIEAIGFGGLLQLATKEIRYELYQWLISAYDVPYHCIRMASSVVVDVTLEEVEVTMGIPCRGLYVPVQPRWVTKGQIYGIRYLESQLNSLPIGDEFTKISSYTCVLLFWHPIINQRECMTYEISYGTLMSQSQEIGENSCLTIWKMAYRNSKQQTEDMSGDVYYSCRYNWKLIPYIIYLLISAIRVANIV